MEFEARLDTPLGPMIAVADEHALHSLLFADQHGVLPPKAVFSPTPPLVSIEQELHQYFSGRLRSFQTPIRPIGSPLQQQVWDALRAIPFGETCCYADLAEAIGRAAAYRAVARINGANPLAIIVPCHRVIYKSGALGGYAGGLLRKQWLLDHEQSS